MTVEQEIPSANANKSYCSLKWLAAEERWFSDIFSLVQRYVVCYSSVLKGQTATKANAIGSM